MKNRAAGENVKNAFKADLARLTGQVCWGFIAGAGTGSALNLNLGGRVPRKVPARNPHLTEEQRMFDGELGLFVECVWRLDSASEVVCGAWDDNSAGGPMLEGLRLLVGQVVASVETEGPAFDLRVGFGNSLTLRVFSDAVNRAEARDNYSLVVPGATYTVGTRGSLRREPRA